MSKDVRFVGGAKRGLKLERLFWMLAIIPFSSAMAGQITLAWDPSPETNVVAYRIYYGVAARTYTNTIQVGKVTTATVSNLVAGVPYFFAATAVDDVGLESDYSDEVSGTIPLPNQPPTLAPLTDLVIEENAGQQTVNLTGITSGATNENQTLTVTATSSNPALIPTPTVNYTSPSTTGSLRFTPTPYAFGVATITVTVNDGAASNNVTSRSFTVTVRSVNQPPTLNPLSDLVLLENAGQQTVNLAGISSGATNENQTLTVTASSSDPGLIPNPTVTYTSPSATGSLRFTPVPYAFGVATITVTVNDGGASNNIVTRSFQVTVMPVNQAPTLGALTDLVLEENAKEQVVNLTGITSGATNENQTLTVTASSSDPGLIPNPTVSYTSPATTGSLRFTPVPYAFGVATITVTVNDGGASNNIASRTFKVTVNSVNQAPTLDALSDLVLNENAGQQTVTLTGISSGAPNENQTLTVTASSSNKSLIPNPTVTYTSPNTTGTIRFTPATGASGSSVITVSVNDGGASNNVVTRTFTVTVNHVNEPPVISLIPDVTVGVGLAVAPIAFTVSDAETAAASLTLSASSDNPTLLRNAAIVFGGSSTNRTVTLTPETGRTGSANVTITVSDGTDSASRTFRFTVRAKPAAPGNLRIAQVE